MSEKTETPTPTPEATDITASSVPETLGAEDTTEATKEAPIVKDWKQNFSVKEATEIEKVDRLSVQVGVNEYKGQHLIFIAKVTDKNFSRSFFSMPPYVWEKAITQLGVYVKTIGEIEKKAMGERALVELRRLAELGVDIKALLRKV